MRIVVLAVVLVVLVGGCAALDTEFNAKLDGLYQQSESLALEGRQLYQDYKDGKIDEATLIIRVAENNDKVTALTTQIQELQAQAQGKGYKWYDILGAVALAVVTGVAGRYSGLSYVGTVKDALVGLIGMVHNARVNKGSAEDVVTMTKKLDNKVINTIAEKMPAIT